MIERISQFAQDNWVNIGAAVAGLAIYRVTLRPYVQRALRKEIMTLWHPESPGMRLVVERNWWQRLLYPREFATLGEACKAAKRGKVLRRWFL